MLDRLVKIKQPLLLALAELNERAPENLFGMEWAALEDCLPTLNPYLELTELLSGSKYVTMSTIVPLIRGLQFSVRSVNNSTHIGQVLQAKLIETTAKRLAAF